MGHVATHHLLSLSQNSCILVTNDNTYTTNQKMKV
jgi:hypothetical protein